MNIIFDLDGTLIDSSTGILKSIEMAFSQCDVPLQQPLTSQLIGPPLNKLLPMLAGSDDLSVIDALTVAFKESYDSEGYKVTTIFQNVEQMLNTLRQKNHYICIATNKRIVPTRKIIKYFGWEQFFDDIYALDFFENLANKKELIKYLINRHEMDERKTLYIGDTVADREASISNNIHYLMAMWGYDSGEPSDGYCVSSPELVNGYIEKLHV